MDKSYIKCLSHIQPRAPYDFYHPYDFLPVRPSDASLEFDVGAVLVVTSGYGPRTVWHGCTLMVWSNDSQDFTGTRAMPVRTSFGPRKGIFNVFISYGTRMVPVRDPQGRRTTPLRTRKELIQPELTKSYLAVRGPLRTPHGLFTGCLGYQNPYGARKLILHVLKLYGPRTGR